jgi:hypothetical protein
LDVIEVCAGGSHECSLAKLSSPGAGVRVYREERGVFGVRDALG